MQPSQYKAVLAKVLRDARIPNADGIADVQVRKMTQYNELVGDGIVLEEPTVGSSIVETQQAQRMAAPATPRVRTDNYPQVDLSKAIVLGDDGVDVYARVGAPPTTRQNYTDDQIMDMKIRAIDEYKKYIPPTLDCQPPGFSHPLKLTCQSYAQGMVNAPFFKIIYAPQGMGEIGNIERTVNILDTPLPSPQQLIKEIIDGGNAKFHSQPVNSPPPVQQPAIALGSVGQAFGVADADSKDRPVQNIGDGLSTQVTHDSNGNPMQRSERDMLLSQDTLGGLSEFQQQMKAVRQ